MPKPVTVYTTTYCPHCTRAKSLLKSKKIDFKEIDVTDNDAVRSKVQQQTGWMTVPMIFIGEEFIGGADELYARESSGKLDRQLK